VQAALELADREPPVDEMVLCSYFSSQKFSFCLVAFIGGPDLVIPRKGAAASSIGTACANTMGAVSEKRRPYAPGKKNTGAEASIHHSIKSDRPTWVNACAMP
jgi:hypothetical protein